MERRDGGVRRHAGKVPGAMDLLEYQGKQLFARHDVPVPAGRHALTVEEATAAADEVGAGSESAA